MYVLQIFNLTLIQNNLFFITPIAAFLNDNFDENSISESFNGEFNLLCNFCKAKYFKQEMTLKKIYTKCCNNGINSIKSLRECPAYLKDLLKSKSSSPFKTNIRYIFCYKIFYYM